MSEHCRPDQRERVRGAAQDLELMDATLCVLAIPPETDPSGRWTLAACFRAGDALPADAALAIGMHALDVRHLSTHGDLVHVVATA